MLKKKQGIVVEENTNQEIQTETLPVLLHYIKEHFALKNEHDLHLFQSPEISTGNASPAQDTRLAVSYLQTHRTQHDDISLEIPGDKAMLLRYVAYVYIRSREYFTPQGARN